MILFDNKEKVIKFIICINMLLLAVLAAKTFFNIEDNDKEYNYVSTSLIKSDGDETNIYVEYPRFNDNDDINKIITDLIYTYVKEFKAIEEDKSLDINYKTYYIGDYVNITFHIENTLSTIKNKNILINLKNNSISKITALYDEKYLENEIKNIVYDKYPTGIYNKIINEDINNHTYIIGDNTIEVYFNSIEWTELNYVPYIIISLNESTAYTNSNNKEKYIAFTYDDGPGEYTIDLLNVLESYKSSATFFVIGNNINGRENIIKRIHKSKSEVGLHGYSHINLTNLTDDEIEDEIDRTNELFNDITNDKISFIRPPYGDYNDYLTSLDYKIILWNIDSKDWLVKDSEKIYNNVIKNACDGCIVLMHDIYPETLDATKMLIPELKSMGYNVVSVSKLMKAKKYKSDKKVISYIK